MIPLSLCFDTMCWEEGVGVPWNGINKGITAASTALASVTLQRLGALQTGARSAKLGDWAS